MWLSSTSGVHDHAVPPAAQSVYLETYGCQMNSSDSEVVLSILAAAGFSQAQSPDAANVILLNTCAIRDKAEERVWQRLRALQHLRTRGAKRPVIGVLGCMAERLKGKLLEADGLADVVAGPDAYRDLPNLLSLLRDGGGGGVMNVQLSADETYADIVPVRRHGATSAFLSIMRGCNNMCSFCIVPFTRGRERSRPAASILDEVRMLADEGVKEVTLLGQNVNSYACFSEPTRPTTPPTDGEGDTPRQPFADYARGFTSVYVPKRTGAVRFGELLDRVAAIDPEMRIRFTSPHPKDFADDVFHAIAAHPNICKQLHLPAQSGSSSMLERMRRGYTREAYLDLATRARALLPGVALSSDFISGFCGETEAEHGDTISLMAAVQYEHAYMFAYSRRDKTHAARHLEDDVPPETKQRRLEEVIATFRTGAAKRAAADVGRVHCVLVEGPSKRSTADLCGRTDHGKMVVFPDVDVPATWADDRGPRVRLKPGDYVAVRVEKATAASLTGAALARTSLREFHEARRTAETNVAACV